MSADDIWRDNPVPRPERKVEQANDATLRDYFAATAMPVLLGIKRANSNMSMVAHLSYAMADAMLEARKS